MIGLVGQGLASYAIASHFRPVALDTGRFGLSCVVLWSDSDSADLCRFLCPKLGQKRLVSQSGGGSDDSADAMRPGITLVSHM